MLDAPVRVVRTGPLVVHDATDRARYERDVHVFTPGVAEGTSGAPLIDDDGRVAGLVVLDNRGDDVAYAVTAAELTDLLAATDSPRATTEAVRLRSPHRSHLGEEHMRRSFIRTVAPLAAAVALIGAACTSDDDDDAEPEDTGLSEPRPAAADRRHGTERTGRHRGDHARHRHRRRGADRRVDARRGDRQRRRALRHA